MVQRLTTWKLPFGGSTSTSAVSKKLARCFSRTWAMAASSVSKGTPSGTEMKKGAGFTPGIGAVEPPSTDAAPGLEPGVLRWTTATKRSFFSTTDFAM